jgi:ABC-2 type transport system ATP-binding protein
MIRVTDLTKRFGDRIAVDGLTFEVAAGRVTGFVGPNGAGKSTTMRAMVGLTHPDHGDVRYDGRRYDQLEAPATVVGAVLDSRCAHPGRTARAHLQATAAMSGIAVERVDVALASVGLTSVADQRAGGFSLGMRQRLALASALLGDPSVLLLDEPANGLDPDGIRWLRAFLRGFADRGGTVLVSSHLIAELAQFVDDLVVIGNGRLLASSPLEQFMTAGDPLVVVESPDADTLTDLLLQADIDARSTGPRISVRGATRDDVSRIAFEHRIRLVELSEQAVALEDQLLALTSTATEFRPT